MKRRLLKLTVLLLLGAIANVAVTWFCVVAFAPAWRQFGWPERILTPQEASLVVQDHFPSIRLSNESDWYATTLSRFGWTEWGIDASHLDTKDEYTVIDLEVICAGWPLYGLRGRKQFDSRLPESMEWQTPGLIELPSWLKRHHGSLVEYVPIEPVMPAFLLNTLFYTAILWLLVAGPGSLRRTIRRRRGLCPKCAYPVGVNDRCTECGTSLAATKL